MGVLFAGFLCVARVLWLRVRVALCVLVRWVMGCGRFVGRWKWFFVLGWFLVVEGWSGLCAERG